MRDRIEFVRMALRTLNGQSERCLPDAIDSVKHFDHAKLLWNDGTFLIEHAVSQESCRHDLILSRVWE